MQITKPLIRKNSSTPSQPYWAGRCRNGKISAGVPPQTASNPPARPA
jgi:hypothetical protein